MDLLQTILLIFIAWFLVASSGDAWRRVFRRPGRKIVLDSCVLIDGRVVEIIKSGFAGNPELVLPQFILNELQLLADGNDSHKRERARFGLDIAYQLQDTPSQSVTIDRTIFPEVPATDEKLVLLAKKLKAQLFTTDYNLGKIAAVEGVRVLNVNELAQSLRPIALPGETITIKIIQRGSVRDQGVGYLDDGTMIVVDGGFRYLNKLIPVTVTRMHQTIAGKMVFGQVQTGRAQTTQAAKPGLSVKPFGSIAPRGMSEKPRPKTTASDLSKAPLQQKLRKRLTRVGNKNSSKIS